MAAKGGAPRADGVLDTPSARGYAEETRNRKLLRENPVADWELRVGRFRVFYEVDAGRRIVRILAVGVKEGSKLTIGGEEVTL